MHRRTALLILSLWVGALLGAGCQSAPKSDRNLILDNHWVNSDTLQILVTGESPAEQVPYGMRRKDACYAARGKIDERFRELYPEAGEISYTKKIERTLYTGKGDCTLIVYIAAPGLRGRIQ